MRGHIARDDPPAPQFHDHEPEQRLEGRRRHEEEIAGQDLAGVVPEERAPRAGRRPRVTNHVSLDRRLRDAVTEPFEFGLDPRRALEAVLSREPTDQLTNLDRDGRSAGCSPRSPAPEESPSLSVPADDGRWSNDEKAVAPTGPEASEDHPVDAIAQSDRRTRDDALEHRNLLAKGEVLQGE